jgi:hypothetical protein
MPMFRRALNRLWRCFRDESRLDEAFEVLQRALRLNEELAENRLLANDDRDAAEQAAAIITGKWSDPEA